MSILIGVGLSIFIMLISLILRLTKLLHLTVPLLYMIVVPAFFGEWYRQNEFLAHLILIVLVGMVILSWIVAIYRKIRDKRVERNRAELDAIINSKRLYYRKIEYND